MHVMSDLEPNCYLSTEIMLTCTELPYYCFDNSGLYCYALLCLRIQSTPWWDSSCRSCLIRVYSHYSDYVSRLRFPSISQKNLKTLCVNISVFINLYLRIYLLHHEYLWGSDLRYLTLLFLQNHILCSNCCLLRLKLHIISLGSLTNKIW